VVEAQYADGVWCRRRLVKRIPGAVPSRWRVRFDDCEVRDDICLDSEHTPVRFDASAYHAVVDVQYDGSWHRGRLVELIKGSVVWGVAFEDGDWAEDVRLGDPEVRYISRGVEGEGPAGRKRKRERVAYGVNARDRTHECSTCGKAFSRSYDLAVHMQVHSGERPHKCSTCGKAFSQSGHLTKHMQVHSGERPLECSTCGKAFSQSGHLAEHMRVHSGERPHECSTCGRAFSRAAILAKHILTHFEQERQEGGALRLAKESRYEQTCLAAARQCSPLSPSLCAYLSLFVTAHAPRHRPPELHSRPAYRNQPAAARGLPTRLRWMDRCTQQSRTGPAGPAQ
jgi:DNA-directed RNA polymerase subunit RPC12/RpoP